MRGRESEQPVASFEQSEIIGDRKVGKQEKFNRGTAAELEKEFQESHDVSGMYFTHAFPAKNLEGIINEGGLRSAAQLRKRKVGFKTGSNAPYEQNIYFSKGFVATGYSTLDRPFDGNKNSGSLEGSAVLTPQSEFHRATRMASGKSTYEDHLDKKPSSSEFIISRERNPAELEAKKLAGKMFDSLVQQAKEKYEAQVVVLEDDFNEQVKNFQSIDLPKDAADIIGNYLLRELYEKIPKVLEDQRKLIGDLDKKIATLQEEVKEITGFELAGKKRILSTLKPYLFDRLVEGLGAKTGRQKKEQKYQKELHEVETKIQELNDQLQALSTHKEAVDENITELGLYQKMLLELSQKLSLAERQHEAAVEDAELKYRGKDLYSEGSELSKIEQRSRQLNESEETEDKLRVGLARSIILIPTEQVAEALRLTEGKPALRDRMLVFDKNVGQIVRSHDEEIGESGINRDNLNAAFILLTKTKDGFNILKSAQQGKSLSQSSESNLGIHPLREYVKINKMKKAA